VLRVSRTCLHRGAGDNDIHEPEEDPMTSPLLRAAAAVAVTLSLAGCASTGQYLDDSFVTAKVKSEMLALGFGTGTDVSVETASGIVQLSGFVSSQAEMDKAVAAARKVEGVRSVSNKMQLKPTSR
jgi:osmotically-inducible protein OsmY